MNNRVRRAERPRQPRQREHDSVPTTGRLAVSDKRQFGPHVIEALRKKRVSGKSEIRENSSYHAADIFSFNSLFSPR